MGRLPEGIRTHVDLYNTVKQILSILHQSVRWGAHEQKEYVQSTLQHTVEIALRTAQCAHIEEAAGKKIRPFVVTVHAIVHDFCEALLGDIAFPVKKHPLLKLIFPMIEEELYCRLCDDLGHLGEFLRSAAELSDVEKIFFDAMERLDYVMYALSQYDAGYDKFLHVIWRQYGKLEEYAEEFPSIRLYYCQELQTWIFQECQNRDELLKGSEIQLPSTDDVFKGGEIIASLLGQVKLPDKKKNDLKAKLIEMIHAA